jgi:hypothetical protein
MKQGEEVIEQWLLRTWRSPVKVRSDKKSDFFSLERERERERAGGGGVKIEET